MKLIRPINCLLAAVAVWVGAYMTWLEPVITGPLLSSIATFLVCAAGNIVNDIVDLDTDRINKPGRVLVQRMVDLTFAKVLSILLNALALLFAYFVSYYLLAIAAFAIAILYLYNYVGKKIPLFGNLLIALLSGMVFITGGVSVDWRLTTVLPGPLIGALFAFMFHLVREIIKDVEDIDGDFQAGIKTIPMVIGVKSAIAVGIFIFFIMTIFTYIPIFKGWYSFTYKIITVYIVDLPILLFLIFLWGNPTPKMLNAASHILKIGMIFGIAALVFA